MINILASLPMLQEGGGSGQLLTMILPFGLIIVVFYFLIIRPQGKKQKETKAMLSALKKNDKVATAGGIRGVVVAVKEETVVIKVDDNVKMEFSKGSVSTVLNAKNPQPNGKGSAKDADSADGAEKDTDKDNETKAKE